MMTTNGTDQWSVETQIFCNVKQGHAGNAVSVLPFISGIMLKQLNNETELQLPMFKYYLANGHLINDI